MVSATASRLARRQTVELVVFRPWTCVVVERSPICVVEKLLERRGGQTAKLGRRERAGLGGGEGLDLGGAQRADLGRGERADLGRWSKVETCVVVRLVTDVVLRPEICEVENSFGSSASRFAGLSPLSWVVVRP